MTAHKGMDGGETDFTLQLGEGVLQKHATVRRGYFDPGDRLNDLYL